MPEPGTTTLDRDSADGDKREAERTADAASGASKEATRSMFRKEDVEAAIVPTGPGHLTFPLNSEPGTEFTVIHKPKDGEFFIGVDHGNTPVIPFVPQRSEPPPEPVPQERENVTTVEDIRARFRKA